MERHTQQNTDSPASESLSEEAVLVTFLEGLTPSDFSRILMRLPGVTPYIPKEATPIQQVAALIDYVRSTAGPGIELLTSVVHELFPSKYPSQTTPHRADNVNYSIPIHIRKAQAEAANRIALPKPSRHFTGRVQTLADAEATLQQTGRVAIVGIPGIGKTELALKLAEQMDVKQYAYFLRGDNIADYMSDLATLAATIDNIWVESADVQVTSKAGLQWLENNPGWLIVLDNVDDARILPDSLLPRGDGFLILTGRDSGITDRATVIEIPNMEPEEGANCLLEYAGISSAKADERRAAEDISREMGGLTLGLEQAGAYIRDTGCGLGDYLKTYRERREDLLPLRSADGGGIGRTIYVTVAIAVERASQSAAAAPELLGHLAFFAPDEVPEAVFTNQPHIWTPVLSKAAADILLWNRTVAALRRLSLIRRESGSQYISTHRMIQDVVRSSLTAVDMRSYADRAVIGIDSFHPGDDFVHWSVLEKIIPHQRLFMLNFLSNLTINETLINLLTSAGIYCFSRGLLAESQSIYTNILSIIDGVNVIHPITKCKVLSYLSWVLIYLGDFSNAEYYSTIALMICESNPTYTSLHISILTSISEIHRIRGKYQDAEKIQKRALDIAEAATPQDNEAIAAVLGSLARNLRKQKRFAEAFPLYSKAMELSKVVHGEFHPSYGQCVNNFGAILEDIGDINEAESYYRRAIKIKEAALGLEHPDLSESLNNLGILLNRKNERIEAPILLKRALSIRQKVYGEKHYLTAQSRHNLGVHYLVQGRFNEAKSQFAIALSNYEQTLGTESEETKSCKEYLETSTLIMQRIPNMSLNQIDDMIRSVQESNKYRAFDNP